MLQLGPLPREGQRWCGLALLDTAVHFCCCPLQEEAIKNLPAGVEARGNSGFQAIVDWSLSIMNLPATGADWSDPLLLHVLGERSTTSCVVVYNDEVHSFEEVIHQLMKATGCTRADAASRSIEIDSAGRTIVGKGALEHCESIRRVIAEIGLTVAVLDSKVVAAQEIALECLRWLVQLCGMSDGIRRILCSVLTKVSTSTIAAAAAEPALDQFLVHFVDQWKEVRQLIRSLIFGTMLVESDFKPALASTFVKHYEHLHTVHLDDEAHENDSMTNISVQLFTVPSLARWLVQEKGALESLLGLVVRKLKECCNAETGLLDCDREDGFLSADNLAMLLHDIHYLLGTGVGAIISALPLFLDLLKLMHGMDPIKRQVGNHVDMESQAWIKAFSLTYHITKTIWTDFVDGCSSTTADLKKSIRLTMKAIGESVDGITCKATYNVEAGYRMVKGAVHTETMSINIPLHRFLAALVTKASATGMGLPEIFGMNGWTLHDPVGLIMSLMEPPMRITVLAAQVRANLWIRNGSGPQHAICNYFRVGQQTVDRDLAMLQIGAAHLQPDHWIATLVRQFQLFTWFEPAMDALTRTAASMHTGPKVFDLDSQPLHSAVDALNAARGAMLIAPPMYLRIVEAFLNVLIRVTYERYVLGIGEVINRDIVRRDMMHQLAVEPKTHSSLKKRIPSNPETDEHFDGILKEIADFRKSSSEYHLKPSLIKEVNLYYHRYTAKEHEDAEAKTLAKTKMQRPVPPAPPLLRPAFKPLQGLSSKAPVLQLLHTVLARAGGGWVPSAAAEHDAGNPGQWAMATHVLVNERVVRQCLHYIAGALLEPDQPTASTFAHALTTFTSQGVRLLSVLNHLISSRVWKDSAGKNSFGDMLDWIMQRLMLSGNPAVKAALEAEGVKITQSSADSESNEDQTRLHAKRKAAAKARRAKVMAKFSAMQASADEKLGGSKAGSAGSADVGSARKLDKKDDSTDAVDDAGEDTGSMIVCIYCQESNAHMCVLAYAQQSTVLGNAGGKECTGPGGVFVTSCGHHMCQKCMVKFREARIRAIESQMYRYVERTRRGPDGLELMDYFCPLCNSLCNFCIPIWQEKHGAASRGVPQDRGVSAVPLATSIDVVQCLISDIKAAAVADAIPQGSAVGRTGAEARTNIHISRKAADESSGATGATGGSDTEEDPTKPESATSGNSDMDSERDGLPVLPGSRRLHAGLAPQTSSPAAGAGRRSTSPMDDGELDGNGGAGAGTPPSPLQVVHTLLAQGVGSSADFQHDLDMIKAMQECLLRIRQVSRTNFPAKFEVTDSLAQGTRLLFQCIRNTLVNIEQVENNKELHNFGVRPLLRALALCSKIVCATHGADVRQRRLHLLKALFHSSHSPPSSEAPNTAGSAPTPVLQQDAFNILVETVASDPSASVGFASFAALARICLILDLVQSILRCSGGAHTPASGGTHTAAATATTPEDRDAIAMLCAAVSRFAGTEVTLDDTQTGSVVDNAVTFLRRVCLLARFCFDDKLEQKLPVAMVALCEELGMGSLQAALDLGLAARAWRMVSNESHESSDFDFLERTSLSETTEQMSAVELLLSRWLVASPGPIARLVRVRTLIPLPREFSQLFYQACQATCPVTGKTAVKPALCLMCGTYVCAQSTCCQVMEHSGPAANRSRMRVFGACSVHSAKCGAGKGIFLLPKTCTLVILDHERGCLHPPPYVDSHGERDPGLTRGRPLFLDAVQYAKLSALFTCNRLATVVAGEQADSRVSQAVWQSF